MNAISSLIELIFDNIYIVVIGLFFLFRLLGGNRKPEQKPTSMPTFGGGQRQNEWDDDDDEDQRYELEEQRRREALEQQRLEQQRMEQQRMEQQRLEQQRMGQQRQVGRSPSTTVHSSGTASDFGSRFATQTPTYEESRKEQERKQALARLTARSNQASEVKRTRAEVPQAIQIQPNDLRKAVVWSEILGQPRAKRPLRRP